ncbi:MAG TPA: phosphoribosylformylglycinamidine synthase subunit PurQ [Chitinophagales bacterium]|jgi:phosphoribosylformylglycinamidine synthase I|nr:phosphoribosylformylglycinamidine synthase subunit PurQ [Chitinophagales bacterium]MBP6154918.1 phosphoribosylformylglycinamidine synthase subunit PurQ [Chitinophagales bacterium]HQV76931.1 phosphoribosylformylglycinamidine synthase subunit PurQ [Chitinophagales bacterium]HQW78002.1 phosphoribosylformylglycinamidine synthase subunit PurQ [Chitinophagales bacterium]HRB66417.1 phosphoribosylformylglycinamidine synthase subunit PurQ [Chitinophagales bacterium]
MKFGVVVFPGSNCDADVIHVCKEVMQCETRILWHKDTHLQDLTTKDCIMIPGGFSYGDYLRCGAIARFSPIMEKVIEHANNGGYVFGICNGFQVLCESHLLPGALLANNHQRFICQNQYLLPQTTNSAITRNLDLQQPINIPIAHGEGRYFADAQTLKSLKENDQILFKYCDANGNINDNSNPNGSIENIAGICNVNRNVFGMMPHPERCAEEVLGNTDGRKLFESLLNLVYG